MVWYWKQLLGHLEYINFVQVIDWERKGENGRWPVILPVVSDAHRNKNTLILRFTHMNEQTPTFTPTHLHVLGKGGYSQGQVLCTRVWCCMIQSWMFSTVATRYREVSTFSSQQECFPGLIRGVHMFSTVFSPCTQMQPRILCCNIWHCSVCG